MTSRSKRIGPLTVRWNSGKLCGRAVQIFYTCAPPHGITFHEYKNKQVARLLRKVAKWLEKQ